MDFYSQTLPPFPSWSADDVEEDGDPGGTCSEAKCVPASGVAFTIISSVGSIIGSLLIICTFLRWKDLRTIARMILVFLALSDLLAGIGYVFGAAIYIQYYYMTGFCQNSSNGSAYYLNPVVNLSSYQRLCEAQSFLTTIMPMASFLWTANLAIYLFFSIVWPRMKFTKILMIIFHVTAWGIPLVTCVVVLSTGYFGSSESRSSGGWCWIKYKNPSHHVNYFIVELMAGKIWEIGVCVLALVMCIAIKVVMAKRFKTKRVTTVTKETEYSSISIEKQLHAAYTKLDQKLIWLPIVFLLLRIWGNIRFFISYGCNSNVYEICCKVLYHPFFVNMQSICDPGQGWSNALLFVIFNKKILHRLCPCLQPCFDSCRRRLWSCALWVRRSRTKKRSRVIKHVNIVAVDGSTGEDVVKVSDRERLLNNSLQSSSNLSTSVLYSSGKSTTTSNGGVQISNKSKTPSINSKY